MYISDSKIKRMFKDAGALRTSAKARKEFRKYIEQHSFTVAQKAVKLAKHASRKTVDVSDIKLAVD